MEFEFGNCTNLNLEPYEPMKFRIELNSNDEIQNPKSNKNSESNTSLRRDSDAHNSYITSVK